MALNDKQKAEVMNYDDLEALINRLKQDNHNNEKTGLKAEGLDWNIKMIRK